MTGEAEGVVRSEVIGHVLRIEIANTARKNLLTPGMVCQLSEALTKLDATEALRVGVICAEGDHFTAGLDVTRFFGSRATVTPLPKDQVDPLQLTRRCRKPVVTAVQGTCHAFGAELMLAGDIVVASVTARFSQMETRLGFAPMGGAHFRYVMRAGWGNAMYHLLLGDEFDAQRAYEIGLVQELVPEGEQTMRAMQLAELIAANAPLGVQATKAAAQVFVDKGEAAAIAMIPELRRTVMESDDAKEGMRSVLQRRRAAFAGR